LLGEAVMTFTRVQGHGPAEVSVELRGGERL
jgi:hypothetical protein